MIDSPTPRVNRKKRSMSADLTPTVTGATNFKSYSSVPFAIKMSLVTKY